MHRTIPFFTWLMLWAAAILPGGLLFAQEKAVDLAAMEKQRCRKPDRIALVFSNGYAGDHMPREIDRFERLLKRIRDGGFNTIHCTYTPARLEACRKFGIRMMVDLLAVEEHHVYKSPAKAEAVCRKLRNDPAVWGYNIWNDPFRKTGPGRRRDINTVRGWDPTHPAYSGTYRTEGMRHLENADVMGYYDFHWKRGIDQHFGHLLAFHRWAGQRDAWFYTWLSATSGLAGKGNFNRNLYSANTGLACGLKGILWFLGTDLMNPKTLEWTEAGRDILRVHAEIAPLTEEMAGLGIPRAIHTTPITRTANDRAVPAKGVPPGNLRCRQGEGRFPGQSQCLCSPADAVATSRDGEGADFRPERKGLAGFARPFRNRGSAARPGWRGIAALRRVIG